MIIYVNKYKTSQELVNDEPEFTGELNLNIVMRGQNSDEQEKIKEHILNEVNRICSELSTSLVDF